MSITINKKIGISFKKLRKRIQPSSTIKLALNGGGRLKLNDNSNLILN